MSPSELPRALGAIAALVVSYAAACWMLTLRAHDLSLPSRLGWLCARLCALGHRGLFLDHGFGGGGEEAAVEREELMIYIAPHDPPGRVIFFATGGNWRAFNVVLSQAVCIGALVGKFPFPNAAENGPFDSATHPAPLPK